MERGRGVGVDTVEHTGIYVYIVAWDVYNVCVHVQRYHVFLLVW